MGQVRRLPGNSSQQERPLSLPKRPRGASQDHLGAQPQQLLLPSSGQCHDCGGLAFGIKGQNQQIHALGFPAWKCGAGGLGR